MTSLVSGQPEYFMVQWVQTDGKHMTYLCDTFKRADELRREIQNMPAVDKFGRVLNGAKGPIRIARFRGEWL